MGLGSLGTLLNGCQPDAGADGVSRMRCGDDVVLAVRARPAMQTEPLYRDEAYGMAQNSGARLVWDQMVIPTEGPTGLVDRAQAFLPGSERAHGTVIGTVRSVGQNNVEEVWCTAVDDVGVDRCKKLVGGFLATSSSEKIADGASHAASTTSGPVTVFGRSLSLPTSCKVIAHGDGADASCSDGVSLSWRRYAEMSEATEAVQATLIGLGDADDGEAFACTIVGEAAQCESHPRAVAGVAYLDGKPVAVLCLGVVDALHHSLCKSIIVPTSK